MSRILILRPQPGADRTAERARQLGLSPVVHPLFAPETLDWPAPPAQDFDALLLTSANGARCAGPALKAYRGLPTYAVGQATADALHAAGWDDVAAGDKDGSAIAARIARDGHRRVLHIAGTTVALIEAGPLAITRIAVYHMAALPSDPALIAATTPGAILLVHSPRAGEQLAAQMPQSRRGALHLIAISANVLVACGDGWASAACPPRPDDDEMLALARALCEGQQQ